MHIAVDHGAKEGSNFAQCVNHLKEENVVGMPQYTLVDRIREAGNQENHEVVRATPEEAEDLLKLVTLLIRSVYFSD
jgi:hypothetical protein